MLRTYIDAFTRAALDAGITRLKFYGQENCRRGITLYQGELEKLERAEETQLFIEGEFEGCSGSTFTEDLSLSGIADGIRSIQNSARETRGTFLPYDLAGLPERAGEPAPWSRLPELVERLKEAEAAAYETEGVETVHACQISEGWRKTLLADQAGHTAEDSVPACHCHVYLSARRGQEVQPSGKGTPFPPGKIPDMKAMAAEAAEAAVSRLNAGSVPSGASPVVLDSHVVCELLDAFMPAFYAQNVKDGTSVLSGRTGQRVASDCVTILEDPDLPGGMNSRRFDDEGVPTSKKALVEQGILRTYLYNRSSAGDRQSGGNGFKREFNTAVATGYTNILLAPGEASPAELLEEMGSGLLITGVSGVFAGANPASGDFSLISQGYLVEHGQRGKAVQQITVAGNFFEMLCAVADVGSDGAWMQPPSGCLRAPSLYIRGLAVSGKEGGNETV